MRSVPPRGSGWVTCHARTTHHGLPTRYRVVVLTRWNRKWVTDGTVSGVTAESRSAGDALRGGDDVAAS